MAEESQGSVRKAKVEQLPLEKRGYLEGELSIS